MHFGAQIASIIFAVLVFLVVFEMVRRRLLRERYALVWLGAALVLIVLAAWQGLLDDIASAVGIATPSNAFFVIAFAFLLILVLHFSTVVSKMSDETRVLAQRLALLERRLPDTGPTGPRSAESAQAEAGAGETDDVYETSSPQR